MSRIGKIPVAIPENVKVNIQPTFIEVEGPKGKLTQDYSSNVVLKLNEGAVSVVPANETKAANAVKTPTIRLNINTN